MKPIHFICSIFAAAMSFSAPAQANEAVLHGLQNDVVKLEGLVRDLRAVVMDLQTTVVHQNEVIEKQHVRINALEDGTAAAPLKERSDAVPVKGLSQGFNPDIGVAGTVQAHLTENTEDAEGLDTITLKELELSFSQYVDPYSRLDAIIALNDNLEPQNIDIEEAYYTHWGLPYGFTFQIGKFRSKTGKQNLLHLHQLETVNYPLVIRDFLGEEGLSSSGVRLQNHLPNPWDIPIEITGEVLRGNNGDSFSGVSRRPIFNAHFKAFFELSDNVDLEIGGGWMVGNENVQLLPEGDDRFNVNIFEWDATLQWYQSEGRVLKLQAETYLQDRASNRVDPNQNPWGYYVLGDYRFSRKWSAGIRFDYLKPRGVVDEHRTSTEISPYLTFWQSEFANFRLQFSHVEPASAEAKADDAVFLQANFLIGSHSHPVQ